MNFRIGIRLLVVFGVCLFCGSTQADVMSDEEMIALREETREMFYHAYNSYMQYAFPSDELKPLSCNGRDRRNSTRGTLDDSLGEFSLTLVDTLDSLIILGDIQEFQRATDLILKQVRFDNDFFVSVFETTIRILGGLLSAHLLATSGDFKIERYNGELLEKAKDVGLRLLPAFLTPTGIPYSRINLRTGKPGPETETCLACAGTLILEFATLSRLTGYSVFEDVTSNALAALYLRKTSLGLYPGLINVHSGQWRGDSSGIGAGSDSFYEYLYKSYMLFGNEIHLEMFREAYQAILKFMKKDNWFFDVTSSSGKILHHSITSLQAFWPGLLVQVGDVETAIQSYTNLYSVWQKFGMIPESYDVFVRIPHRKDYPLRPELIESTYFLYLATKHPVFLQIAKKILHDLQRCCRVTCGFAAVADVVTKRLDDRMDSFFLTETLKYLYLIFDKDNFINKNNFLFTTEGHPFPISPLLSNTFPKTSTYHCPIVASTNIEQLLQPLLELFSKKPTTEKSTSIKTVSTQIADVLKALPKSTSSSAPRIVKIYFNRQNVVEEDKYTTIHITHPSSAKDEVLIASIAGFGPAITEFPLEEAARSARKLPENEKLDISGVQISYAIPKDGCGGIDDDNERSSFLGRIVLVDRGGCNFVDKVRNAQKAGAVAVIVSDNVEYEKAQSEEGLGIQLAQTLIMNGDGTGITIPSVFVRKSDGDLLKNLLQQDIVRVTFKSIPTQDATQLEHLIDLSNIDVNLFSTAVVEIDIQETHEVSSSSSIIDTEDAHDGKKH